MSNYDSEIHHRRSVRYKGYDYRMNNAYVITICTHEKRCWFGDIVDEKMILNQYGQIAEKEWIETPNHRDYVVLHEYIVMPNHFHAILEIKKIKDDINGDDMEIFISKTSKLKYNSPEYLAMISPKSGSLSVIVRAYKSAVTRAINLTGIKYKWQDSFYETIIRGEEDYVAYSGYIKYNPINWHKDKHYKAVARNDPTSTKCT